MDTIFALIILFLNDAGDLQGGAVRFPSPQACEAGATQAEKDFFPLKIQTACIPVQVPSDEPKFQPKPKKGKRIDV